MPWTWSSSLSFEGELKSTYILSEFHGQGREKGHERHYIFTISQLTGKDDHKVRRKRNHPYSLQVNLLQGRFTMTWVGRIWQGSNSVMEGVRVEAPHRSDDREE
jgi:hypothetical protein